MSCILSGARSLTLRWRRLLRKDHLMRAFTLDSFDTPPGLREDLPTPGIANDQLLVRVQASSVNPVDAFIAAGALKGMAEYEFPVVLGRDYAGVVERVGAAVTGYAAGDEVYGFLLHANPTVGAGSWAELIAVQLAASAGATVLAPGLAEDEDYLHGLGVAEVIDRNTDIPAAVRERHPDGVDALLDLVSSSPEALDAHATVVRDGGRAVSSVGAAGQGQGRANVGAVPSPENLDRLAGLLAAGTLSVPIQASYSLAQADQALKALTGQHTQGKLAITLP